MLRDVIDNGPFDLMTDYWKVFKVEGEVGIESVFEIQASKSAGDGNIYWSRLGQCQGCSRRFGRMGPGLGLEYTNIRPRWQL